MGDGMGDRLARMRYLEGLDPYEHCQEIHRISSNAEFPWDYGRGLEIAVWRTCCVPSISKLLARSGEFAAHAQKRYDDTRILIGEIVAHGYDSERGKQALRRINQAHRPWDIDNEQMLYVLSTFVYEPVRWINRWAWRKVTPTERLAGFLFFVEVGRRMNVKSLPEDVDEFERFNLAYERRWFSYADSNRLVTEQILGMYSSWYPPPLRPVVVRLLRSRLDERALNATGQAVPPWWAATLQAAILRGHATFERYAPRLAAATMTRPAARTYPGYPHGYDLNDIGPSYAGNSGP